MAEMSGFEDLADEFEDFANETREYQTHVVPAIDAGMGVTAHATANTARQLVPVDSGALKSTIRVDHVEPMHWEVLAGNDEEVDYAPAVEFGTDEHPITPDDADALHFTYKGEEVFTQYVWHPGTPEQSFLRPAFQKNKSSLRPNVMNRLERAAYYTYS